MNDEPDPDPGGGGGGVNSNVRLAVLDARVLSSVPVSLVPLFPPEVFLPGGVFFVPRPGVVVRRLDDDGAPDAPIAKVPGARGVPLETSEDAKETFGENGFEFASPSGEKRFGEERFGEKRFGEERFGENVDEAANPSEPPGARRPPDASTPPGEKKSNGGGESGVPPPENVVAEASRSFSPFAAYDDGERSPDPTCAARLFAARLDASLDAADAPSAPDPGERGPAVAGVDRRRCRRVEGEPPPRLNLIVVVVVVVVGGGGGGGGSVSIPPGARNPRLSVSGDPTSIGDASDRAGGLRAANGGGGCAVGSDRRGTGSGGRGSVPRSSLGCHASPSDSSLLL